MMLNSDMRLIAIILLSSSLLISDDVFGEVSGTWDIDNSPYLVVGDLLVNPYNSLIIEPGVEVVFMEDYEFRVEGELHAVGTEQDSIYFRSDTPGESTWKGISFQFSTDLSEISYADIQNTSSYAVYSYYANPITITHSSFHDCNSTVLFFDDTFSQVTLSYLSIVESNGSHGGIQGNSTVLSMDNIMIQGTGGGYGVYYLGNYELFMDNVYVENFERGLAINSSNNFANTINNSRFTSNVHGVSLNNGRAVLDNCEIDNNVNHGIHAEGNNNTLTIHNSQIYNSNDGIYVIGANDHITINTTDIYSNSNRGMYIERSGNTVSSLHMDDSSVYGNGSEGIYLSHQNNYATDYSLISTNIFDNGSHGFDNNYNNTYYYNPSDIQEFIGSNLWGNGSSGIHSNQNFNDTQWTTYNRASLTNCIIRDNDGHGVMMVGSITNSLIVGNQSYGVYGSHAPIINSTISTNAYGVIKGGDITNSIIFFNSNSQIDDHQGNVSYSNIMGDYSGEGNIDDNPAFLDYVDYELHPSSPCIDAGNPDPSHYDLCFPPSNGNVYNDMGAYGGPGACDWITGAPPTQQEIILILPNIEANPGDSLQLSIEVSFPDSISVSSFALELDCLNDIEILSIENGELTSDWYIESNIDNCPIPIWGAGSGSISDQGELFKINLQISEDAEEQFIPISLGEILFDEYDFDLEITEGGINITEEIPDPPLIPNYGDASLNGNITPFDASMILKYVVGLEEFNDQQFLNSDVSGDSTITSMDASYILQYGVGLIEEFPAQNSSNVVGASGDYSMDIYTYNNDLQFEIPVYLNNGDDIFGFEHHFNYDSSIITITEIVPGINIQNFIVQSNLENNTLVIAGASSNEDGIAGTFFTLRGVIHESYLDPSATIIKLEKVKLNENQPELSDINYTTLVINGALGDVNANQIINVVDIVNIINFIYNILIPNDYQNWASDLNADMEINVVDIVALVNIILDL